MLKDELHNAKKYIRKISNKYFYPESWKGDTLVVKSEYFIEPKDIKIEISNIVTNDTENVDKIVFNANYSVVKSDNEINVTISLDNIFNLLTKLKIKPLSFNMGIKITDKINNEELFLYNKSYFTVSNKYFVDFEYKN